MPVPFRRVLALRALALGAVAALLARGATAASAWQREPALVDLRYEQAQDVRGGVVDLPWTLLVDGRPMRRIRVGTGWIELESGVTGARDDARRGARVDVLPVTGEPARLVADVGTESVAVRWIAAPTAAGPATAEAILTRDGRCTVQMLRVPRGLPSRDGAPPPMPASAWSLRLADDPRPAGRSSPQALRDSPKSLLTAPAGCDAEIGSWCDRATGDGGTAIWIDERFDDGASRTRGWTASGAWSESAEADCGGGAAAGGSGGAWRFGDAVSCAYPSRATGDLASGMVGPLTADAELRFTSRLATEVGRDGMPVDRAEILVDGAVVASLPAPADPLAWMQYSLKLPGWTGRSVRVGFRFTSDGRNEDAGWFVDDVVLLDPNVGKPSCRLNAGRLGATPCETRRAPSFSFDEDDFCAGCAYVFYVLVECGREMHLPLSDMEGADVRVTNMLDPGAPPALHCVNDSARADALGGPRATLTVRDAAGAPLDCCGADGVPEDWWGPSLDVTDSAGPGRVAWGLGAGCPVQSAYDAGGGVTCADLPPTCGGLLDRLSPGEEQVVDCFIRDESGLCGLYRVEVISGGNVWSLFANCDGTAAPRFPIFFDCTEAWAAFDPLPEIALAGLRVAGACPAAVAELDVLNVGCAELSGDVMLRFESGGDGAGCGDPVSWRVVVPGPIPAGGSVHVTQPITAWCPDAIVTVIADPLDEIRECSEGGAFACRAEAGLDRLEAPACSCAAPAPPPPEVSGDRVARDGATLSISWSPDPAAATWRVARGRIGSWYSHGVDELAGAGTCDTLGAPAFSDADDGSDGSNWYYLVTALDACGREGLAGWGFDGLRDLPRPAGNPSPCD